MSADVDSTDALLMIRCIAMTCVTSSKPLRIALHCIVSVCDLLRSQNGQVSRACVTNCRNSAVQGPKHHGAVQCHSHAAHHVSPQASSVCGAEGPHLSHAVQGPTPAHHAAPSHDPPLDNPQQQSASPVSTGVLQPPHATVRMPNLACPYGCASALLVKGCAIHSTYDFKS